MFCKTCGTLLVPKKTMYGNWMACPQGHKQPVLNQEENVISMENNEKGKEVTVHDGINHLAVHNHKCKKCGHDKAELIEVAPFYSDEDPLIRMKCGKCGCVERLEGKIG